jgi:hypothetical protein
LQVPVGKVNIAKAKFERDVFAQVYQIVNTIKNTIEPINDNRFVQITLLGELIPRCCDRSRIAVCHLETFLED